MTNWKRGIVKATDVSSGPRFLVKMSRPVLVFGCDWGLLSLTAALDDDDVLAEDAVAKRYENRMAIASSFT
jgi:hypothetical protein